jgi:hypothetical protein
MFITSCSERHPSAAKATAIFDFCGTTEEAAEKPRWNGEDEESRPSAAKAAVELIGLDVQAKA